MGIAETYSKLSNDEILNLAVEIDSLTENGRTALLAELAARSISAVEIDEYKRYLSTVKPGELPGKEQKERFVARSFNGFGTSIYGKRDFLADGSYVTTKWVVLFWIPILPLNSMRIREVGGKGKSSGLPGWSANYTVYSKGRPNLQQVLYVYGFMFAFARAWWNFEPKPNVVNTSVVCVLLVLPFFLRKVSKTRALQNTNL
jgi:hypothetical protein